MSEDPFADLDATVRGQLREQEQASRKVDHTPRPFHYNQESLREALKRETVSARLSGVKAIAGGILFRRNKGENAWSEEDKARMTEIDQLYENAIDKLKNILKESAIFSGDPDLLAEAAIKALSEQGEVPGDQAASIRRFCSKHFETEKKFSPKGQSAVVGFVVGNDLAGATIPITFISGVDLSRNVEEEMGRFVKEECNFLESKE